tara:strand:- start:297 stop:479 length:183 start_codon:yes stop_codon:yes gene_type:complete
MQVGDLVERSWPSDPGRVGLLVKQLPKSISTGVTTGDFFVVQWADGVRDTIRSQFLRVVK